jgi:hypothetical protein
LKKGLGINQIPNYIKSYLPDQEMAQVFQRLVSKMLGKLDQDLQQCAEQLELF